MDECRSYIFGNGICRDGFPVSALCMGSKCHCCGRWTDKLPACQREDLGPHLLDETGAPRLAEHRRMTRAPALAEEG